jgi:hypothetical protein
MGLLLAALWCGRAVGTAGQAPCSTTQAANPVHGLMHGLKAHAHS